MLRKLFFAPIFIIILLGPNISTIIPPVQAAVLIDCEPTFQSGDLISRGFYIQSYPGTTLSRIDLWLKPNDPGTYTFSLVACGNAFDGTQIGLANTTVTLNDTGNYTLTSFNFLPSPVAPGSLITFKISKLNGPESAITFIVYTEGGCPVVETEDTTPPWSNFRRDGIAIKVYGDPPQAISWQGDVSFPIKTTFSNHKNPEKIRFAKSSLPFTGTMQVFTAAKALAPDAEGCYVKFSADDGTRICIEEVVTVESWSEKSKTHQLLLRGTGVIATTIDWVPYTGVVYLDATSTLKENDSGELISINLKGKMGGGADLGFVFNGNFNADLTK